MDIGIFLRIFFNIGGEGSSVNFADKLKKLSTNAYEFLFLRCGLSHRLILSLGWITVRIRDIFVRILLLHELWLNSAGSRRIPDPTPSSWDTAPKLCDLLEFFSAMSLLVIAHHDSYK